MDFSLYFYLRTDKTNKEGKHPLYLFYVFKRKFLKIPVGISLLKEDWLKNDVPSPNLKDFKIMIHKMDVLERKVHKTINDYQLSNGNYPATEKLKEILNNQPQEQNSKEEIDKDFLITELFNEFIKLSELDDKTKSTITVYRTTKWHWEEFEKFNKTKYKVSHIEFKLLENFSLFLKNNDMMFSTVGKHIKTMKTLINFMIKYKKIQVDPSFKEIKVEREEENNFVVLSFEEYEKLRRSVTYSEYELEGEKVNLTERECLIGKLFLFMCSTGVSYTDLMNLGSDNFHCEIKELKKVDSDKKPELMIYLKYDRQKLKRKSECIVPLHDHTLEILLSFLSPYRYDRLIRGGFDFNENILKKWVDENLKSFEKDPDNKAIDFRIFPPVSNSDFNIEIKDICQKLEFDEVIRIREKKKNGSVIVYRKYEKISSHTGRRTFVTLCLSLGIRPDILMKSTGHLKFDTMKRYNRYTTISIHEEFEKKILFRDENNS
jgi:integrase